nr:CMESO_444 [Cryptomonas curvata]
MICQNFMFVQNSIFFKKNYQKNFEIKKKTENYSFLKNHKNITMNKLDSQDFESIRQSKSSILLDSKEEERDKMFDTILQELSAIQQNAPRRVAILGTRHFSYLHQQIVELLTYANVLVGNHVFTSGGTGSGTNAAVIRGALRAEKPDLLTVVLPQSKKRQPPDVRDLLEKVQNVIEMKENDELPLDVASRLCNSDILSRCEHLISFAFHDSIVVLEAAREAKSLNKLVTLLYLD